MHQLHFAQEPEGAGLGDVPGEHVGVDVEPYALAPDEGMIEIDGVFHTEAVVGLCLDAFVARAVLERLGHGHHLARHSQFAHTRTAQEIHEGSGAAVHDGHLAAAGLDQDVVDTQPAQGGQQMLDGGDRLLPVAQGGGQPGAHDLVGGGGDELGPVIRRDAEYDAGVRIGREQFKLNLAAAVQADAGATDTFGNGGL